MEDIVKERNKKVADFWKKSGFKKIYNELNEWRGKLNTSGFIEAGDIQNAGEARNKLRGDLEALIEEWDLVELARRSGLFRRFSSRRFSSRMFSSRAFFDRDVILQIMWKDLKGLDRLKRELEKGTVVVKNLITIQTFNRMGYIGILIFSPASFIFNAYWLRRCNEHASDDSSDLFCNTGGFVWGSFGLHPFFMSAAFLLCAPLAVCSYRIIEGACGASHRVAKIVHVLLQLATAGFAWAGLTNAWTSNESTDTSNVRSAHSIMGSFLVSIYVAHLLASLFILTFGSKELRASFHMLHMAIGQGIVLGGMFVASLGILYFETETYYNDWDVFGENGYWRPIMSVAQYCIICAMMSMVLLFYGKSLR